MKKVLLFFLTFILCFQSFGQDPYELSLAKEVVTLEGRKFYIASVIDNRTDQNNIGVFRLGFFDSSHPVQLKEGLNNSLQNYFDHSLPREGVMLPMTIKVKTFKIAQWRTNNEEMGSVDLAFDYYYNNELVFTSKKNLVVSDDDVMQRHEGNIRNAILLTLQDFNKCVWVNKLDSSAVLAMSKGEPVTISTAASTESIQNNAEAVQSEPAYGLNRNVFTLGYQIAGYSMVGLDCEIRFHDYFGIHAGAGYLGYTYGLMIHTAPYKNSPYINLSFKDGGFGVLHVAAIEYGARLVLNKQTGMAMTFQFGVAKILKIHEAMVDALFEGETPNDMLTMGIGLSW